MLSNLIRGAAFLLSLLGLLSSACELPEGSWDSHLHIIDEEHFPFAPDAPYRPMKADLAMNQEFEHNLSPQLAHIVIITPSIYGTDNSITLDSLVKLNGSGRGVAVIDPDNITDGQLQFMHNVGIRGIRLNLRTTSTQVDTETLNKTMTDTADRIRKYGWALQLYVSLDQIEQIAPLVPALDLPVIFDHIGSPNQTVAASQQPGYNELLGLLKDDLAWVKISGTYRFPKLPDLDEFMSTVIATNPDRALFATDWPHTGGVENNPDGDPTKLQPYRQVDDVAFVEKVKAACGSDEVIEKVFKSNPDKLWA